LTDREIRKSRESMMSNATYEKPAKMNRHVQEWIWEILIVVIVVLAAIYGVVSLGQLPII
jgi:hypothetical protein